MNRFKYSDALYCNLSQNAKQKFSISHSMVIYNLDAVFSFIPKNACSSMRLTVALANGCIRSPDQVHWIHSNNTTFNASIPDAIKASYTFVLLRCPHRRLASAFLDKIVSKEPEAWSYKNRIDRNMDLDSLSFRDFVESFSIPGTLRSDIHWRPQVDFLLYDEYTDYYCVERMREAIQSLKSKIKLDVVDARSLTKHGVTSLEPLCDKLYCDTDSFELATLKRSGRYPSYESLYDKELFELVSHLYEEDIALYREKLGDGSLMSIEHLSS